MFEESQIILQYPHKDWKHGKCFRGFNTAASVICKSIDLNNEVINVTYNNIGRGQKFVLEEIFLAQYIIKQGKTHCATKIFSKENFLASILFLAFLQKLNFTNFYGIKCLSQSKKDNNFPPRKFFSIVFLTLHNNQKHFSGNLS